MSNFIPAPAAGLSPRISPLSQNPHRGRFLVSSRYLVEAKTMQELWGILKKFRVDVLQSTETLDGLVLHATGPLFPAAPANREWPEYQLLISFDDQRVATKLGVLPL